MPAIAEFELQSSYDCPFAELHVCQLLLRSRDVQGAHSEKNIQLARISFRIQYNITMIDILPEQVSRPPMAFTRGEKPLSLEEKDLLHRSTKRS